MKNLKYIFGAISALILIVVGYFYFGLNPASANPDYICIKSVQNPTCDITNCEPWDTDTHQRICHGVKVTQVGYYHTRTACNSGYSKAVTGKTATSSTASRAKGVDYSKLDAQGKAANTTHPSSGRHSKDFAWDSYSCSITEIDNDEPMGDVEQVLDNGETIDITESDSSETADNAE